MKGGGLSVLSKHGDVLSSVVVVDDGEVSLTIVVSSDDGTSKFLELDQETAKDYAAGLRDILKATEYI